MSTTGINVTEDDLQNMVAKVTEFAGSLNVREKYMLNSMFRLANVEISRIGEQEDGGEQNEPLLDDPDQTFEIHETFAQALDASVGLSFHIADDLAALEGDDVKCRKKYKVKRSQNEA